MDYQNLEKELIRIARLAGKEIMDVYSTDFDVEIKQDNSPLTIADQRSNAVIIAELQKLYPEIPILSEEGKSIEHSERKDWNAYFCVDPLDGTKEFVKRNGEFSVLIAYMEKNEPVFGVVYAPVLKTTWWGGRHNAACKQVEDNAVEKISVASDTQDGHIVIGSRSHSSNKNDELLEGLQIKSFQPAGSAIKFCYIADGTATIYPRANPTMEWDTCAGQAIVEAAGGTLTKLDGSQFEYNKENLLNPGFIVKGQE